MGSSSPPTVEGLGPGQAKLVDASSEVATGKAMPLTRSQPWRRPGAGRVMKQPNEPTDVILAQTSIITGRFESQDKVDPLRSSRSDYWNSVR